MAELSPLIIDSYSRGGRQIGTLASIKGPYGSVYVGLKGKSKAGAPGQVCEGSSLPHEWDSVMQYHRVRINKQTTCNT